MMYIGKEAQELVGQILNSVNKEGHYPLHEGDCGYYKNADGIYTTWDNITGDCWVEDFKSEKDAKKWCEDGTIVSGS